jgi:hypothetical protein
VVERQAECFSNIKRHVRTRHAHEWNNVLDKIFTRHNRAPSKETWEELRVTAEKLLDAAEEARMKSIKTLDDHGFVPSPESQKNVATVLALICSRIPFHCLSSPYFKTMISFATGCKCDGSGLTLCKSCQLPSATTARKIALQIEAAVQRGLEAELGDPDILSMACTADCWTDLQQRKMLAVTGSKYPYE